MQGGMPYGYPQQGYPAAAAVGYADPAAMAAYSQQQGYMMQQSYPGMHHMMMMQGVPPVSGVPVPPVMIPGVPPVSGIPIPGAEDEYGEEKEEISEERKQRRKERKETREKKNKLELHGDLEKMNLSALIYNNILGSTYFKGLYKLKTYHEIVDEIYYSVEHLEPFMPNSKMASQAWCLMYKCFTIKLTKKQVTGMLDHADSPYIRAIGFLYLRMCTNPKLLWDWFEPYLADEEEITIRYKGKPTTIGSLVEDLLTTIKFVDAIMPRFPALVGKEINDRLAEWHRKNPGVVRKPTDIASDDSQKGGGQRSRGGGSTSRSSSSSSRDRDRAGRDRDRDRDSGYKRSRSRSRERSRGGSRDRGSRRDDERDRDRKRARTSRSRSRSPSRRSPDRTASAQKKAPSAEHMAKMRMLAAKYGSSSAAAPAQGERKAPVASSATEKDTMVLGRRY